MGYSTPSRRDPPRNHAGDSGELSPPALLLIPPPAQRWGRNERSSLLGWRAVGPSGGGCFRKRDDSGQNSMQPHFSGRFQPLDFCLELETQLRAFLVGQPVRHLRKVWSGNRSVRSTSPEQTYAPLINFRLSEISLDAHPKSPLYPPPSRPIQRGVAQRHGRWGGMRWTRAAHLTGAVACGRPRRVVLMPRCWHQVRGRQLSRVTVAKKPVAGESTLQALKPLRGECRVFPAYSW